VDFKQQVLRVELAGGNLMKVVAQTLFEDREGPTATQNYRFLV